MKKEGKTIIAVDDEKDIRDTIKSILSDEDFTVLTASNGKEFLSLIDKTKPDLILMDILMPGMTTKEILAELNKKKVKTPIIFLTVVRLAEQAKELITDHMADYIEKPFDNKDLIARIKKALK